MLTGESMKNREDNLRMYQILDVQGRVPVLALPSRFYPTYEDYFISF